MDSIDRAESNALSKSVPPGTDEPKGNLRLPDARWHVYILRCADDSFYVGSTCNLEQQIATHNRGQGASWTAARRPVTLIHSEIFATQSAAVARERQLKRWSKAKKDALIHGDLQQLHALARCRSKLAN